MYDFMYRVYTLHTASHVLVTKGYIQHVRKQK